MAPRIARRPHDAKTAKAKVAKEEKGESFAKRAVEAGDTSAATVEKALALADVPLSGNRRNVIPKGQVAVRGAVCGMFVYAHRIGVSSFSRQRPWLTRLLTAFCRDAGYNRFPFTSIQVNVDYAARPHVDRNNLGKSLIVGLGRYTGGRLWVHDEKGKEEVTLDEDLPQEPTYKKGGHFRGSLIDISGKWSQFDGNRLHCTQPFKGKRYSLVYFTCDRYAEAPEAVRQELKDTGFTFRWKNERLQKMRATKKIQRREVCEKVRKEKFSYHKGIVPDLIDKDCVRYELENPKLEGCNAYLLYEKYKRAKSFGEAKRLGARNIDLLFDFNQSFMKVTCLHPAPQSWSKEVKDPMWPYAAHRTSLPATGSATVKVRVQGMRLRHPGIEVPRAALYKLQSLVEALKQVNEQSWAAEDGPMSDVPLGAMRILLCWAQSGKLRLRPNLSIAVAAALRSWGKQDLANLVSPGKAKIKAKASRSKQCAARKK